MSSTSLIVLPKRDITDIRNTNKIDRMIEKRLMKGSTPCKHNHFDTKIFIGRDNKKKDFEFYESKVVNNDYLDKKLESTNLVKYIQKCKIINYFNQSISILESNIYFRDKNWLFTYLEKCRYFNTEYISRYSVKTTTEPK